MNTLKGRNLGLLKDLLQLNQEIILSLKGNLKNVNLKTGIPLKGPSRKSLKTTYILRVNLIDLIGPNTHLQNVLKPSDHLTT